jgi:2-polyprenyl-3-methyl-5-hydroxy-6-metoxy-1,4-benzoquinol methylase
MSGDVTDAHERLSLEAVSEHTVIACEHIHRYEFAASLLPGLRVLDLACGSGYGSRILADSATSVHGIDNDLPTIRDATDTIGSPAITFEAADVVSFLSSDLSDRFDAIVCFEGLEHLDDLEGAVRRLRKQADRGLQLVVSVPNSRAFEEHNAFHLTDFGYEEALCLLETFPSATMLLQYLTEGSFVDLGGSEGLEARLTSVEQAEPEYANHFLITVNVDEKQVLGTVHVRDQLTRTSVYNRYMRSLEAANRELRSRNSELARIMLRGATSKGPGAGAIPAFVDKLNKDIDELETSLHELELVRNVQSREIAARDELILAQRRELLQLRQQIIEPRRSK